jgi:hypothetical protein
MPTVPTDTTEVVAELNGGAIPRRIHVAPVGFEVDRVVEPIVRMEGERAVLLAQLESRDRGHHFLEKVVRRLKSKRVKVQVIREDIHDLYALTRTFSGIFRTHSRDSIFLNVSSGSKIEAIGAVLASMLVRGEGIDVTPYYAVPVEYTTPLNVPLSKGCAEIIPLPHLSMQVPSTEIRESLSILKDGARSKSDLAVELAKRNRLDSRRLSSDGKPRDEAARVSLQTAVDVRVVRKLEELKYALVRRKGREAMVGLTPLGLAASEFFHPNEA